MSAVVSMTRNQQAGSNCRPNILGAYQEYEQIYTTLGPQEWIALPDAGQSKVSVSFPTGTGSAVLEGTCSPADMLYPASQNEQAVSPANKFGAFSPIAYSISDSITEITAIVIQGDSAIRLNVIGAPAVISVRC